VSPRPGGRSLPAGLLLFAGVWWAGCGGEGSPRASAPTVGNPAPHWEGRTLEGGALSLADLSGEVVVLNVWATWCAPCVREMPGLEELHRAYTDRGLRVVGASVDRGSAQGEVRRFLQDHELTFTILLDPDQSVMTRFRTLGVPETFLIDRDGIIAYRWIGEFDPMAPEVLSRVEELLARQPS